MADGTWFAYKEDIALDSHLSVHSSFSRASSPQETIHYWALDYCHSWWSVFARTQTRNWWVLREEIIATDYVCPASWMMQRRERLLQWIRWASMKLERRKRQSVFNRLNKLSDEWKRRDLIDWGVPVLQRKFDPAIFEEPTFLPLSMETDVCLAWH